MTDDGFIDYPAWGQLFFPTAVTTERVLAAVNGLSGQPIHMGPMGVGPGRMAKVAADGEIGTATGERISENPVAIAVRLPVTLEFGIDFGLDVQRFTADIMVPLRLIARACDDLSIFIEVQPPQAGEVTVQLEATSLRASITKYAANIEGELKRFVAKYVAREIDKPYVHDARRIDVAAAIGKAARGIGPGKSRSEELTSDLSSALEEEIREAEDVFVVDEAIAEAAQKAAAPEDGPDAGGSRA